MPDTVVDEEFLRLADPYRRELLAHCYRMLGSAHDAEDLVQETYLRGWRAYGGFEGRSSLRTWLHRIATRACLTALEGRDRRPMPTGLGGPADPDGDLAHRSEVPWLEPVSDTAVGAGPADPAEIVTTRDSVRLAFIAALQHLPPRQRAVLLLRDVLAWRAAEVADALGSTTAAVNSMLQRARAQLAEAAPGAGAVTEPTAPAQRDLLDRYVVAFEAKDIPALVRLFTSDVVWEMPPYAAWYRGPEPIGRHLALRCPGGPGSIGMVPVAANGQPGFAQYLRGEDGVYRAFNVQVLTLTPAGVAHVANFVDPGVFPLVGQPPTRPAAPDGSLTGTGR